MTEKAENRNPLQTAFFAVGSICGVFWLLFIGSCIVELATMHSDQQVSGEVTVSSEWIMITPKEPLKLRKQNQELVLDVAEPLMKDNLHLENIRLTDGT